MAKRNLGIAVPILTRRCKRCGKFWAACHPKDTRELCERCREDGDTNRNPADNSTSDSGGSGQQDKALKGKI